VVESLARTLRRQVAVLGKQVGNDSRGDTLEIFGVVEGEAAKEDGPVAVEVAVELIPVAGDPVGEVDTIDRRVTTSGMEFPSIVFVSISRETSTAFPPDLPQSGVCRSPSSLLTPLLSTGLCSSQNQGLDVSDVMLVAPSRSAYATLEQAWCPRT